MNAVLSCGTTKHFNTKMKSSTFALIDDYQNMVKRMNEGSDTESVFMGNDQEVPISPFCSVKREIKLEPVFCDMSNFLTPTNPAYDCNFIPTPSTLTSNNNNSNIITSSSSSNNIPTAVYEEEDSSMCPVSAAIGHNVYTSFLPAASTPCISSIRLQSQQLSTSNPSLSSHSSSLSSSLSSSSSSSPSPFWSAPVSTAATFHEQSLSPAPASSYSSFSSPSSSLSSSTPSSIPMSSVSTVPSFKYPTSLSSSSPLLSASPTPSHPNYTDTQKLLLYQKTFVSEQGQNGCTLLSTVPNFLSSSYTDLSATRGQNDFPEYTDLDSLPELSFYDELNSANPGHDLKKEVVDETSMPLEVVVGLMRDALDSDRRKLNLVDDPQMWTSTEVARWMKWVCQKNNVSDISGYFGSINGSTLCSWPLDSFSSRFGISGSSVYTELELWKTASSYEFTSQMSEQEVCSTTTPPHQQGYMRGAQGFPTPSVSPAPSNGSSNSHDHNLLNSSMEHSEDEVFYSETEQKSATEEKIVEFRKLPFKPMSGRGHKKAITLWQFLLELLIGKDDNTDCIRWLNKESRIFKIEDSKKVATMWGKVKSRPAMNYDKLSRSVRQYYKKGIIKKPTQTKRLVYQFCPGIY